MGEVNVWLGIWTANDSAVLNVPVKVDTGATYCQLPANILRTLGWEAVDQTVSYQLADGSTGFAEVGIVKVRYRDADSMEWFVFGESSDIKLLGVETLQNLSLGVDPVNHRLIDVALEEQEQS